MPLVLVVPSCVSCLWITGVKMCAVGMYFHLLACMSRHCAKIYEIIRVNGVSDYFIFLFYFNLNLKSKLYEPPHGKTNNLHRRKQRRRSASR